MVYEKLLVKGSLLVCLYFSICEAAFPLEGLKKLGAACNASDADMAVALKYEVPSTDTGKCLMLCILKAVETISPQGLFNYNGALKGFDTYWNEFPKEQLKKVADECNDEIALLKDQANTCEYGYRVIRCINSKFKALNLLKPPSS